MSLLKLFQRWLRKIRRSVAPLHFAARTGKSEAVSALVRLGADVNAKDKYGWTPLYVAALKGKSETVLVLIRLGADNECEG